MKLEKILTEHSFPPEFIKKIMSSGVTDLYPPQAEAIEKGVLDGNNLVMSVPTAAGKTLIAELSMINSIIHNNGKCLYIAPLKALASEKYKDFKKQYAPLGVEVGITIGDRDTKKKDLANYQILVATAEKVDSLLRSKAQWLIDCLTVVILDEIHFINDGSRGPTLEVLTARIRQLNAKIQIVALSATVKNASEIAQWLGAQLVHSQWRPIPLKEGVYFQNQIKFDNDGIRVISEEGRDDINNLCLDTLRGKGQVLIFVCSRRSAQAVSREVCRSTAKVLTPEEKIKLETVAKKIVGTKTDSTKICQKLADAVSNGSAFHHAGLKPKQRELVEENFKKNLIKVIGCTPTLAAGVNLPARRAIIRDVKRFEVGVGSSYIPTSEYKQCAGRAGRPQYDKYGEAVLVAKSFSESGTLFEKYIHAEPEPVTSKLQDESILRIHVLASIAGGYVFDIDGMFEFISHTFLYHQNPSPELFDMISNIFDFLLKEKFIEKTGHRFFATLFGSLTSRLYIDPVSSIRIRDGLEIINSGKQKFTAIGAIHLMACCPNGPRGSSVGKKLAEDLQIFLSEYHDDLIFTPDNCNEMDDYYTFMASIKSTWLISEWINEEREDSLCDKFNAGPGDIYRHVDDTQRLLYAAGTIADLFRMKKLTFDLENLKARVRYGVKDDLVELVKLKNVGRVRARLMHNNGIKKITDLDFITAEQLAKIPQISKKLAEEIKSY